MGRKFNPFELELYRATDEVLHYVWDPIGVSQEPMARDEYHAYLPLVFARLQEDCSPEHLAMYLVKFESERIGVTPSLEHAGKVAKLLVSWRLALLSKYSAADSSHA